MLEPHSPFLILYFSSAAWETGERQGEVNLAQRWKLK